MHFSAKNIADIWKIAFIDFLLVMVAVLIQLASVHKIQEGIKPDVEYQISAEWSKTTDADVDLWGVPPPGTNPVFYNNREVGALSLDRDSRGFLDNKTTDKDGQVVYLPNKEVQIIRGIIPGTYTFGLHMYLMRVDGSAITLNDNINVPVHVEVIKMKPTPTTIFKQDFTMTRLHQAINVYSFTMTSDGGYAVEELPLQPVSDIYYSKHDAGNTSSTSSVTVPPIPSHSVEVP